MDLYNCVSFQIEININFDNVLIFWALVNKWKSEIMRHIDGFDCSIEITKLYNYL